MQEVLLPVAEVFCRRGRLEKEPRRPRQMPARSVQKSRYRSFPQEKCKQDLFLVLTRTEYDDKARELYNDPIE